MMYQFWLANLDGIGNTTKRKLLKALPSAKKIYETDKAGYVRTGLIREDVAEYIEKQKKWWSLSEEYEKFLEKNISFLSMEAEDYPLRLRPIRNAPYALYYIGSMPKQEERLVSIVGARRCSVYGKTMAEEIGYSLAKAGYGVVSGMALGVDGAAHRGCLHGKGKTYAFLGCGVDVIYPRFHEKLYHEIIESGAVVSDYPPGTVPLPEHFPTRNRLIAGISEKTIVVEARKKSGSLITADLAMEQGKDVLAVPGRMTDVMSEGTNHLISQGAGIIKSVKELISDCEDLSGLVMDPTEEPPFANLNLEKEELMVYSCLDFYAKGLEEVMQESGLDFLTLLSAIMRLGELGLVRETFKNQYIRLR